MSTIIAALFLVFLAGYLFYQAKKNPGMFSKELLGKSFHTMGILALILIAFVWLCVSFLNHT